MFIDYYNDVEITLGRADNSSYRIELGPEEEKANKASQSRAIAQGLEKLRESYDFRAFDPATFRSALEVVSPAYSTIALSPVASSNFYRSDDQYQALLEPLIKGKHFEEYDKSDPDTWIERLTLPFVGNEAAWEGLVGKKPQSISCRNDEEWALLLPLMPTGIGAVLEALHMNFRRHERDRLAKQAQEDFNPETAKTYSDYMQTSGVDSKTAFSTLEEVAHDVLRGLFSEAPIDSENISVVRQNRQALSDAKEACAYFGIELPADFAEIYERTVQAARALLETSIFAALTSGDTYARTECEQQILNLFGAVSERKLRGQLVDIKGDFAAAASEFQNRRGAVAALSEVVDREDQCGLEAATIRILHQDRDRQIVDIEQSARPIAQNLAQRFLACITLS